jgi:hypothetical protein
MALKTFNPTTPSQRHLVIVDRSELWKGKPVKALTEGLRQKGGRNNTGRTTMRWRGGGHKRRYRVVDFKRIKDDAPATVERLEYDPNRTAFIALIRYPDGEQSYILAPQRLRPGDSVVSGERVDVKPGNAMPLRNMPPGTIVHNVEMKPGKGGQLAHGLGRGAHGARRMPGDDRRGVEPRPPEHRDRQGRAQPVARTPAFGARRGDEPDRPSARRRRRQVLGRAPSGDPVGQADQGQENPAEQGDRPADRPPAPADAMTVSDDGLALHHICVTPAKAGVQGNRNSLALDSRFRGNDSSLGRR